MNVCQLAAYRASLRQAADWALVIVMTIALRHGAPELRQRAAIKARRGLTKGLKADSTHPLVE
ncbi:hypothetical protein GU700_07240 [Methylobacterium sp. NI91]|nr:MULTISPECIES: hypothetical protein [unclassified Methylobacterium]QIJ74390.1 hypothetical protein CLZ_07240 [Methylobacterium sp. CLZ]QIJ79296.1 hypothetical protein GU700_07240 [Methylobacterium sp. NI91]